MRFRFASNVGPDFLNPYIRLFYQALEEHGIHFVKPYGLEPNWNELHLSSVDAIHIHWPEWLWRSHTHSFAESIRNLNFRGASRVRSLLDDPLRSLGQFQGVGRLTRSLELAASRGIKIIWTCHNIEPHDGLVPADKLGYRELAKKADLVICHSEAARDACLAKYKTNAQAVVMKFGNYEGAYPTPRPRSEVIKDFGLDASKPLLISLGCVRRYKGLESAIEAAKQSQGRFQYLIAGLSPDREYAASLEAMSAGYPSIHVIPRELSDAEFADLSATCDLMILPYLKITGSSALLLAFTFQSGVICSDLTFFRDALAEEPAAGRLFQPGNPNALLQAIDSYLKETTPEQRKAAAARLADLYSWPKVVRPVVDVYRGWKTA